MRIHELDIDGFGRWSGLRLEDLAEGLNVFHGPNEAGKTTLLQFIRSVLYGFLPERRRRYLPPLRGGRAGGTLDVTGPAGRFRISRYADGRSAQHGELHVEAADGSLHGDHVVAALVGHVDEATFNNVFAVGLREIQELGSLGDTAAAELLYSLSTGVDRVSLVDVLRELNAARERLLSSQDHPGQVTHLLAERERLTGEIEELRGNSQRHAALAQQCEQLAETIRQREAESVEVEHALRAVEAASSVREAWRTRAELDAQLAAARDLPELPADLTERLQEAAAGIALHKKRLARLRRRQAAWRAQGDELGYNRLLARHAPRIEALLEQEAWISTLESQVAALAEEVDALGRQHAAEEQQLGLGAHSHATGAHRPRVDERTLKKLAPLARALRDPRHKKQGHEQQASEARQAAERLSEQIRAALAGRDEEELAPALERAGHLAAQLRRRVQLDERLSQLKRHQTELEEESHQLLDRQLVPGKYLFLLGGVFVFGAVLFLSSFLFSRPSRSEASWLCGIVGVVALVGSAIGKFFLEQAAESQLDSCQQQARSLVAQIEQVKEERDALDAELPRGGGPLLTRLHAAEKDLAALEELLSVDGQRQAALQEAEQAHGRHHAAEAESGAARRRWQQALVAFGLPANLSPKQVRQHVERCRDLDELHHRWQSRRQDLDERRRELSALTDRVAHVLSDVGLAPLGAAAADRLQQLREELARHNSLASQREVLRKKAGGLRRRQVRLAQNIRRLQRRRRHLLREAGAANEHELTRRTEEQARLESLRSRRDAAAREIAAALGQRLTEDDLRGWLEGPQALELETRWEELTNHTQALERQLQSLFEERGRVQQDLAALALDRRLPSRLLDLGAVEEQLRRAIERWQVLAATGGILDAVRKDYEADRQPETLREASHYFERLTQGRYMRVWTPMGEQALRIDDADGHSLPLEVLSRGTREQLFLALRLALVGSYARRGIELPLVLDDVLVNFDLRRAKAAAAVLRDFGEAGHQLFVFTGHEHIFKLFKQLKVLARKLPEGTEAQTVALSYPPADTEPEEETVPLPRRVAAHGTSDPAGDSLIQVEDDETLDERLDPASTPRRPVAGGGFEALFANAVWHEPWDDELSGADDEDDADESDDEEVTIDPADGADFNPPVQGGRAAGNIEHADDAPEDGEDEEDWDESNDEYAEFDDEAADEKELFAESEDDAADADSGDIEAA